MPKLLVPLSLLLSLAPARQDTPPAPSEDPARALWKKVCAASGDSAREPITAFQLRADVLQRDGVGRNEATIDYGYLAPNCIRFMLPSKQETGCFGPAPEQYWLKDGEQVVTLAGREYKEDRRKVDEMIILARNYVALSNPARIELERVELLSAPPADLGPALTKLYRKHSWLALESPSFALVRRGESAAKSGTVYRVELGLMESGLPAVAVIREREQGGADPLLVEFSKYADVDGFKLPKVLTVRVLDRTQSPVVFAADPSQEVYVQNAALRPKVTVEDFKPAKK